MGNQLLVSLLTMGGLGLILSIGLAIANKRLKVEVEEDPRIQEIASVLPGLNCGACGFAMCSGFAKALVEGKAPANGCIPGGEEVAKQVASILRIEVEAREKKIAKILCYHRGKARTQFDYQGLENCRAANLLFGGNKTCLYSCLGLGDCIEVCPFDAITLVNGKIEIDEERCTGCGKCVSICPKGVVALIPEEKKVHILCNSKDKGAIVRKICKEGCIGCGICVKVCPEEAITLKDNLAYIDYEKCTECGICAEKCPTHVIQVTSNIEQ
ncbi:MAG TPA: Fe-S cluster domain-containing protein [bacterium]|nr:Fe-S cluster domain-containing protein [bacterium]